MDDADEVTGWYSIIDIAIIDIACTGVADSDSIDVACWVISDDIFWDVASVETVYTSVVVGSEMCCWTCMFTEVVDSDLASVSVAIDSVNYSRVCMPGVLLRLGVEGLR